MVATPLAMSLHAQSYAQAALVIQWHVVGMYAPGFFTGHLIARFGVLKIIVAGAALMGGCAAVVLAGSTVAHFLLGLVLVGFGWNFMYTGATALLTEAYTPADKAKAQGANDFVIFTTMGVSAFASGALLSSAGWEWMNIGAIPVLAIAVGAVAWLGSTRRRAQASAA